MGSVAVGGAAGVDVIAAAAGTKGDRRVGGEMGRQRAVKHMGTLEEGSFVSKTRLCIAE